MDLHKKAHQTVDAMWLNDGEPVFFQGVLKREQSSAQSNSAIQAISDNEVYTFYPNSSHSEEETTSESNASILSDM